MRLMGLDRASLPWTQNGKVSAACDAQGCRWSRESPGLVYSSSPSCSAVIGVGGPKRPSACCWVLDGGFLQAGDQEVAIVQRVDKEHGQAIISATRQTNTAGTSGTGTILGIVIKALGPGASKLSIVQINARDSQQRPIQLVTGEASVQVEQ